MLDFKIDESRCIQCGECVADCPARVLQMDEYPEMVAEGCFKCQHCLAICPVGALSILGKNPDDSRVLAHTLVNPDQLAFLIKGRRSVRRYAEDDLPEDLIDDLLETAWYAPTGVNAQQVLFTVVRKRVFLDVLRQEILVLLAEMRDRSGFPDGLMGRYMRWVLSSWEERQEDVVFRGAPHVLVATCHKDAPCHEVDAIIALTTFDLYAHSNGVGTVWDGIFTAILQYFPELKTRLGIPSDHVLGYAMAFGKPAVGYARTVQRGPAQVNSVEL